MLLWASWKERVKATYTEQLVLKGNDLLRECATPEVTPGGLAQWCAFAGLDMHDGFQC